MQRGPSLPSFEFRPSFVGYCQSTNPIDYRPNKDDIHDGSAAMNNWANLDGSQVLPQPSFEFNFEGREDLIPRPLLDYTQPAVLEQQDAQQVLRDLTQGQSYVSDSFFSTFQDPDSYALSQNAYSNALAALSSCSAVPARSSHRGSLSFLPGSIISTDTDHCYNTEVAVNPFLRHNVPYNPRSYECHVSISKTSQRHAPLNNALKRFGVSGDNLSCFEGDLLSLPQESVRKRRRLDDPTGRASHFKSCDRCRHSKLRCDPPSEEQRRQLNPSAHANSDYPCFHCYKNGIMACVYDRQGTKAKARAKKIKEQSPP